MNGASLRERIAPGRWKSYEMVLQRAPFAPEGLSAAAQRIERAWAVVVADSTISLRQKAQRPTR
jgi:hypothetical protein